MNKKVVLYWRHKGVMKWGQSMIVYPINHPDEQVSNTKPVTTSTVMSFDEPTGEFETLNTVYKPYPPKGDSHHAAHGTINCENKQG